MLEHGEEGDARDLHEGVTPVPQGGGGEDEDKGVESVAQQDDQQGATHLASVAGACDADTAAVGGKEQAAKEHVASAEEAAQQKGAAIAGDVEGGEAKGWIDHEAKAAQDAKDGKGDDGEALEAGERRDGRGRGTDGGGRACCCPKQGRGRGGRHGDVWGAVYVEEGIGRWR